MSLIETQDCLKEAWRTANRTTCQPQVSVAAWFPYHFVQPELERRKFPTLPMEALGIDSMGMFYITHGKPSDHLFSKAVHVAPFIDHRWIDWLLQPETSPTWQEEYSKDNTDKKRYFPKFTPETAYPGQHSCHYMRYPSKEQQTLRDQLNRFLEPHETALPAFQEETQAFQTHRTSGCETLNELEETLFRSQCHPYHWVKELRLDMLEWIQDNKCIQQGTHFPLCINLVGKQLERTHGTEEYKAKQSSKAQASNA